MVTSTIWAPGVTAEDTVLREGLLSQDPLTPGTSLVGYNHGGANAVGRSLTSRLREFVTLADYATLKDALATGKNVWVPAAVGTIVVPYADTTFVNQRLEFIQAEANLIIQLAAGAVVYTSGNLINVGKNSNITLLGAAPVITNLASVASVTGSAGNYTVIYNLVSGANVAVGDYLKLDNVIPLLPLAGDQSVFRIRVAQNEFLQTSALLGTVTCNAGGGSIVFSGVTTGVLTDYISVGDLIWIKGAVREVASITGLVVTIVGAWPQGISASRSYRVSRPNTGTVGTGGVSSATVTGVGTSLLTEANVGDFLVSDGVAATITAIASPTSCTVSPAVTITTGAKFSIITPGVSHQGTHEITAVNGAAVTVKNTWRGPFAPPVNRISGGEAKVIKTILKTALPVDGMFHDCGSELQFIDNLVLVNTSGSTGTHGIGLNGRTPEGPTQLGPIANIQAGASFAVTGWGRGVFAGIGCTAQLRHSHIMDSKGFGAWGLEGSNMILREAVVGNTVGRGLQVNAGARAVITAGWITGNTNDGSSQVSGSVIYGEIPVFYGNGGMGARNNGGFFDCPEGFMGGNVASNYYALGGGHGNLARITNFGAQREGLESYDDSTIDLTDAIIGGCRGTTGTGKGILATDSNFIAPGLAVFNHSNALSVDLSGMLSTFKATLGALVAVSLTGRARGDLTNAKVTSITVGSGGDIYAASITPTPTLVGVPRFDEFDGTGSIIRTGSTVVPMGVNGLKIAGGATLTKVLTANQTFTFGSIPANSSVSQTITIAGATTVDQVWQSIYNASSLVPDGIAIDAGVTAANTVTVRARNNTAGAISVTASLKLIVIGTA